MERLIDGKVDKWKERQFEIKIDGIKDIWKERQMKRLIDFKINRQFRRRINNKKTNLWTDRKLYNR